MPAEVAGQLSLGVSRSVAKGTSLMGFVVYSQGNVKGAPAPGSVMTAVPADSELTAMSLGLRLSVAY